MASQLPSWLDAASTFADAIVALDDGSTDDTRAVLAAHPLVATLLTNPMRVGHLGWHDGRNRNRLLAASAALEPDWIMSLDADERLDRGDAEAMRRFVTDEALPGCAYGFQVHRMQAEETYDPNYEWVYRLFAFREGQRFVNRRIDLVPVPVTIGPQRWVRTTLRIRHYGEVGEVGRARRVAKYRETDPEGVFRDYYETLQAPSPGPYPRWRPREASTPVLVGGNERSIGAQRPYVACLLPARDCAHLLPGWFESIERIADAVIALDDGSVDNTGRLLREHPLVVRVLTNAPRDGFGGWDDGENRNRLLAAAAELEPEWIISVDADERIPLEDAIALRRFLRYGAEPGYAYSLASYRMIGDEDHYDRLDYDAYRLFAWEPGHRFPDDCLHAPPVPTTITHWRQTTIRMKHLVSLTEVHRRARREKFAQADPDFTWEPDYDYTIEPPGEVKGWEARPLGRPVLVNAEAAASALDELDLGGPILSVVVPMNPGDEREVAWMLRGLAEEGDATVQYLAATRDGYAAEVVERLVDGVEIVRIEPDWTDAGLRNVSLRAARGDYVAFLELGDEVSTGGLADVIEAHERGFGVVRFTVANAPGDSGELNVAPASFAREQLLALGGFDDNAIGGLDEGVARTLLANGFTATTVQSVKRKWRTSPAAPTISTWLGTIGRTVPLGNRRRSARP